MNFRTTAILAILLAGMVVWYTLLRQSPALTAGQASTLKPPAAEVAAPLIEEDALGEVVRIVVRKDDGSSWTFEKEKSETGAGSGWMIIEPFNFKASGWEVDRIARDLKSLKYEVSHPAGAPGSISAADAGLEPPQYAVTLSDTDGKTKTVQIGKPASPMETFVRLEGGDRIAVATSNLRTLIKKSPVEYRDLQVWTFTPENVRRVEIEDRTAEGGAQRYVFSRDAARWMMEAPATARATDKVNEALQAVSRMRVAKWHENREAKPAIVGLEPAALTFRVTVEEQVPAEKATDDTEPDGEGGKEGQAEEPPATKLMTTTYELHVSKLSPIGEDTKTYIRVGNENAVGTILKTTTDKLKPVMNEWREMRLTTAAVDQASRIELNVGGERGTLLKTGEGWKFDSGEKADEAEVGGLLTAVQNLAATAFLEPGESDSATAGLDSPQADIAMTIPGVEGSERIVVGNFTDETSRRLRFARRGTDPVAKVRANDVESLIRPLSTYRDRAVVNVPPASIERLSIRKPSGLGNAEISGSFVRSAAGWEMAEPVQAAAAVDTVNTLVNKLSQLRATAVAADGGDPSSFGLAGPVATVVLTVATVPSEGDNEAAPAAKETIELVFGQRGAQAYAMRSDRPTIYEVPADVLDQVRGELRSGKIFDFDTAGVSQFTIHQDGSAHTFVRKDSSTWTYATEPDLPLNSTKVENLLLQIKDIEATRFLTHVADDLAVFGLDQPSRRFHVALADGKELTVLVSERSADLPGTSGSLGGTGLGLPVFVIPEETLRRLQVILEDLEAA